MSALGDESLPLAETFRECDLAAPTRFVLECLLISKPTTTLRLSEKE